MKDHITIQKMLHLSSATNTLFKKKHLKGVQIYPTDSEYIRCLWQVTRFSLSGPYCPDAPDSSALFLNYSWMRYLSRDCPPSQSCNALRHQLWCEYRNYIARKPKYFDTLITVYFEMQLPICKGAEPDKLFSHIFLGIAFRWCWCGRHGLRNFLSPFDKINLMSLTNHYLLHSLGGAKLFLMTMAFLLFWCRFVVSDWHHHILLNAFSLRWISRKHCRIMKCKKVKWQQINWIHLPATSGEFTITLSILHRNWVTGHRYVKAEIMLNSLSLTGNKKMNLFFSSRTREFPKW